MRAAITAFLTAASVLASPAAGAASPPGTPHVTVGADTKQLIFDWDDAIGATYYRLLYKIGAGAYKPLIDNIWTLRSVVKSPNPALNDTFGAWVAFCGTGNALAVGAVGEDSKAKGVDGNRTDNSAPESGAAYLY